MNQNQPQNTQIEAAKAANVACKVKLPDGSQRDAVAGVTTPHDVALGISKSLAKDIVVAKVCERERGKEKEREREERETKKSREGRERRTNGGLDLLLPPRFLQPRPQPPILKYKFTPPHTAPSPSTSSSSSSFSSSFFFPANQRSTARTGTSPGPSSPPAPSSSSSSTLPRAGTPSGTPPRTCWARRSSSRSASS